MAQAHNHIIVGIGNRLRGDDGAGLYIASQAALLLPGSECLLLHAPDILLSNLLSQKKRAVFADASVIPEGPDIVLKRILPSTDVLPHTHHLSIETILRITEKLWGRAPLSWLVTVRGRDFSHGERLTPECRKLAKEASRQIVRLMLDDASRD